MHKFLTLLGCLVAGTLLIASAGCDKNRRDDYYEPRSTPVQSQAAVQYPIMEEKGVKFAVLRKGALVTSNINNWRAITPEFFNKMTGITVNEPEEDKTYHPGKGYVIPRIEASEKHPERKLTGISAGYLVPKEIHGWVAMSQETFDDVTKKWMTSEKK